MRIRDRLCCLCNGSSLSGPTVVRWAIVIGLVTETALAQPVKPSEPVSAPFTMAPPSADSQPSPAATSSASPTAAPSPSDAAQPIPASSAPVEPAPQVLPVGTVQAPPAIAEAPPGMSSDPARQQKAALDAVLAEAARDLGLELASQFSALEPPVSERRLLQAARDGAVLSAELRGEPEGWLLRLRFVPAKGRVISLARTEVNDENLEVRAIQLLRDLSQTRQEPTLRKRPVVPVKPTLLDEQRSPGRALLTAHGALVGGYVVFSLEHIGGSGDARLVYPLMTIGAGAGVGASLVIAEEWDISVAEAWYIWAAGTWSAASGMLIADTEESPTDSHRYGYGMLGAATGLTLGTVALNSGQVYTGGALFTHSGALFGAFFGGLGQMLVEGNTDISPTLGVGLGTGSGLLIAGGIAPIFGRVSSSRVLFVDLSAILGGLAGAAVASPLLVGDRLSPNESRLWLGSIAVGAVGGAVVGVILTRDKPSPSGIEVSPYVGAIPGPLGRGTTEVIGFTGQW